MDRHTQTLALLLTTMWLSGCAGPFAKHSPVETTTSEQASSKPATSEPAKTTPSAQSHSDTIFDKVKSQAKRSAAEQQYLANNQPQLDSEHDADPAAVASDAFAEQETALPEQTVPRTSPPRATALAKRGDRPSDGGEAVREPAVDRQTILDVLAEMEAAGLLDAESRGRLLDDLKQTDPALWPQLITYFRASLTRDARGKQVTPVAHQTPVADADAEEVVISDRQEAAKPAKRASATTAPAKAHASVGLTIQPPLAVAPVAPALALEPATTAAAIPTPATAAPAAAEAKPLAAATAATATNTSADAATKQATAGSTEWRTHLAAAIAGLEQETTTPPDTNSAIGRHAALRLLYLADGRREQAVKPIVGVPPAQQDFWSKELFGLATYLDSERNSETSRRAAEAGVHLQGAAQRLAELATLQVKNLSFCTEVSSYGVYKKFEHYEFQAGQEVLLYAEVENFRSEQTEKGFHTSLKASYQILDSHGARVAEHEFKLTEEYCHNARRDYFTNYFVWLPKRIYGGTYTLQLTLEDVKGQKIGQSSVDFTIKEKP